MASIKSFKTACIILLLLGLLTIGVCVWLIAFPVKVVEILGNEVTLERGHHAQVGIVAGGLMSLIGLAACCPLPERCPRVFAFGVFIALVLCATCAGLAIHSHESDDVDIVSATVFEKQYKELQTREKVMAACAIMDSIAEIIALLIFCLVRTPSSNRNIV